MLNPDITIKRGDHGKVVAGQFLDSHGAPVPLPGSITRKLFMRGYSTNVIKINGANFIFLDAEVGTWSYTMTPEDVDTSGVYKIEFEVTRPGIVDTFPTDPENPYLIVLIQDDMG